MTGKPNQLRIIGGQYKRRLIRFAHGEGLRPTPDRMRETLFNWLMWDIHAHTRVLDVCAGSGALGFEALSRGAQQVTFIEPNAGQCVFLNSNLHLLGCSNAQVMQQPAQQALPLLAQRGPCFDLVFLDPPFALNLWQELALLIDPLLAADAKIYVEADQPLSDLLLPARWQLRKDTRAGHVRAGLFTIMPDQAGS